MKHKLSDLAEVWQGSILTRIKALNGIKSEYLTMQELSYYCNQSDIKPEPSFVMIDKAKHKNCYFSQKGDVIIGLASGKTMVIEEERSNKLILSNLAILRIKDTKALSPYYLCWLINESDIVRKQILPLYQKTTRVKVIPLSTFKEIEIEYPNLERQVKIGKTYDLIRRKLRISRNKSSLCYEIINSELRDIK